jgi:hypothetical protein
MSNRRQKSARRPRVTGAAGETRDFLSSHTAVEEAIKGGKTVLLLDAKTPDAARAAKEMMAQYEARVAALPQMLSEVRALLSDVDRFTVMTQAVIWFTSTQTPEFVLAPIEFIAAIALERPTRAPAGREGQGLDPVELDRLMGYLLELMRITPLLLVFPHLVDTDGWSEYDLLFRFLNQQLNTPNFATDAQERRLLQGMCEDERLSAALRDTVGIDGQGALRCYDALRSRTKAAQVASRAELKGLEVAVAGIRLGALFRFTEDDLRLQGVSLQEAQRFCELYSQPLGTHKVRLPGLTSSLRAQPIVRDTDGTMLCTHIPILLRALRPMLRSTANPDSPAACGSRDTFRLWVKREDQLVGAEAKRLMGEHLRIVQMGREAEWRSASDNSDLDVWGYIENHLLAIQIKAGKRRPVRNLGDVKALAGDIQKLVTDAIEQHDRFERVCGDGLLWRSKRTAPPLNGKDELTSIVLTLDDMSACAVVSAQLRDAGLTDTAKLPWIVNLAHFEQTLELLDTPAIFLHFLRRRLQLSERQILAVADEIDLVLHYLSGGLEVVNVGDPSYGGLPVREIAGKASLFRQHVDWLRAREGIGAPIPKPSLVMPDGFAALLARLDEDRPNGFLAMSLALLDLPRDEWSRIDFAWREAHGPIASGATYHGVDIAFKSETPDAVGFTLLRQATSDSLDSVRVLADSCASRKRETGIDRWYGAAVFSLNNNTERLQAVAVLEP